MTSFTTEDRLAAQSKMKARKHRGSFAESMETMEEIDPTWEAVEKYFGYPKSMIKFHKSVFDDRKGWKSMTFLVTVNEENGGGVHGMTSLPLE